MILYRLLFVFITFSVFLSCNNQPYDGVAEPYIKPVGNIPQSIHIDAQPESITWEGEELYEIAFHKLNRVINDPGKNPLLTSPCKPPASSRPSLNYAEHYRCGSLTVMESECNLWEEVIPLRNGKYEDRTFSSKELSAIMDKAVNYGNHKPPTCRCQKTPANVIRYRIQATNYVNETLEEKPLTRRIWVMTTYNCCGPC